MQLKLYKIGKVEKYLYILITLFYYKFLRTAHRMRCGARGICKVPEKQTHEKPEKIKH
jgi:hypothetical protein